MFRCFNCNVVFEEPEYEEICLEHYYGVGSMFSNYHYSSICICPYCGSEDFDEEIDLDEDYEEEEVA